MMMLRNLFFLFQKGCFLLFFIFFLSSPQGIFSQKQRISFNTDKTEASDPFQTDFFSSHSLYKNDGDPFSGNLRHFFDDVQKMFRISFDFPNNQRKLVDRNYLYSSGVDILTKKDRIIIKCVLPGVKKEDINIEVRDNFLMIFTKKKLKNIEKEESDSKYVYRSIKSYSQFSKRIPLPNGIKENSIKAVYKNGILRIEAQCYSVKEKSQKIQVQ